MQAKASETSVRPVWAELDVMRGLAAILMILNHAGFAWLSARDATGSVSGYVVFAGSFAPVLFFFVTGAGAGFSDAKRGRPADFKALLPKVSLLVVADQFFAWTQGEAWCLDFFSFIALSTLVVDLASRAPRSELCCALVAGALLLVRYGLGPALASQGAGNALLDWIVGVRPVANVSYPLTPWLVFPLIGFAIGRWCGRARWESVQPSGPQIAISLIGTGLLLVVAAAMASLGLALFRWGTVSATYFALSLAVLLAAAQASLLLRRSSPLAAKAVALRGTASFALIPVHYLLIGSLADALPGWLPMPPWMFAGLASLAVILSFVGSSAFATSMEARAARQQRSWLAPACLGLVVACMVAAIASKGSDRTLALALLFLGQMAVAAFIGLGSAQRPPRLLPDIARS